MFKLVRPDIEMWQELADQASQGLWESYHIAQFSHNLTAMIAWLTGIIRRSLGKEIYVVHEGTIGSNKIICSTFNGMKSRENAVLISVEHNMMPVTASYIYMLEHILQLQHNIVEAAQDMVKYESNDSDQKAILMYHLKKWNDAKEQGFNIERESLTLAS